MRTFYIRTFGCQMNVHDSDRMRDLLVSSGMQPAQDPEHADLVVVNTCSVRHKAEAKADSEVGTLVSMKRKNKGPAVIAVTGCVASHRGHALAQRLPGVDLVLGPDHLAELPALARAAAQGAAPLVRTSFDADEPSFLRNVPVGVPVGPCASVTISKGCSERCSFCIVPATRGLERHRPAPDIVQEIDRLVDAGVQEVTLLGQTVNSYQDPSGTLHPSLTPAGVSHFPALLRLIALRVPRLRRLRYTSPHPRFFDSALAQAHRDLDVLCRHVHMPVQSGSDAVLRRMIRRHSREEFVRATDAVRHARPDLTISTDIIVGFPGETEMDFEATLSLMTEVRFFGVYAFQYSPRPGTAAERLHDDVPPDVKSHRLQRVLELADRLTDTHLQRLVGTRQHVLLQEPSERGPAQLTGRTDRNEIVHVPQEPEQVHVGELVEARIVQAFKHSLLGVLEARPTGEASRKALPTLSR